MILEQLAVKHSKLKANRKEPTDVRYCRIP